MIDDYMKLLSLGMVMDQVPISVRKKLLYDMLRIAKITLSPEEIDDIEKQYQLRNNELYPAGKIIFTLRQIETMIKKTNNKNEILKFMTEIIDGFKATDEALKSSKK